MKFIFSFVFAFLLLFFSYGKQTNSEILFSSIVMSPLDKEIVEKILLELNKDKDAGTGKLVVKVGKLLLANPYVGSTLEIGDTEKLVVNLRQLDCTTFAENCLALARTVQHQKPTFESFTKELLAIRYRDGQLDQYPSRLHYFSDWIYNNSQKGYVLSLSEQIANTPISKKIDFMTQHVSSYPALKNHPEFIKIISSQEYEISNRKTFYIPKEKLAQVESELQDGDILGITTTMSGMDISHVVIALRVDGRIHIMHASQLAMKVIISTETLEEYLNAAKSRTGIMVARPL
jgi:hypothetical protein